MSCRKLHLTNSFSFCLVPVDNGNVGKDTLAMARIVLAAQPRPGGDVVHFVVSLVDSVDTLVYPGVVHVKLKYIPLKKRTIIGGSRVTIGTTTQANSAPTLMSPRSWARTLDAEI